MRLLRLNVSHCTEKSLDTINLTKFEKKDEDFEFLYKVLSKTIKEQLYPAEREYNSIELEDKRLHKYFITHVIHLLTLINISSIEENKNIILSRYVPVKPSLLIKNQYNEFDLEKIKCESEIKTLISFFPFLTSEELKIMKYGVKKKFSFKDIVKMISNCLQNNEKEINVQSIIEESCKQISQLTSLSKRIMKEEKEKNPSHSFKLDLQNILLSCQANIIGFNKIQNLFARHQNILKFPIIRAKEITEEIYIPLQWFREQQDMKIAGERKNAAKFLEETSKKTIKKLYKKILSLQEKIQNYHEDTMKLPFVIIEKKESSEYLQKIIKKIQKKCNLLSQSLEKKRLETQIFFGHKNHEEFNSMYWQEERNVFRIVYEVMKFQTMTLVFIITYQLSKHFEEMDDERFFETMHSLTKEELFGIAFITHNAKRLNDHIDKNLKKEEAEDLHLMSNFLKRLENSSFSTCNKILNCIKQIDSNRWEEQILFKNIKEEFFKSFEENEEKIYTSFDDLETDSAENKGAKNKLSTFTFGKTSSEKIESDLK